MKKRFPNSSCVGIDGGEKAMQEPRQKLGYSEQTAINCVADEVYLALERFIFVMGLVIKESEALPVTRKDREAFVKGYDTAVNLYNSRSIDLLPPRAQAADDVVAELESASAGGNGPERIRPILSVHSQFVARGRSNTHEVFCNNLESYIALLDLAILTCDTASSVGKVFSESIGGWIEDRCDQLIGAYNSAVDTFNRVCVLDE